MDYLKKQIAKKLSDTPYHATEQDCKNIVTDFDHFPYTRWYRGDPTLSVPVVAERQAGWRIRHDECYKQHINPVITKPNVCFQPACNTTFPCYSSTPPCHVEPFNKSCIVQNY